MGLIIIILLLAIVIGWAREVYDQEKAMYEQLSRIEELTKEIKKKQNE